MDRGVWACRSHHSRLPRERGDGPSIGVRWPPESAPPPRARGWTARVLLPLPGLPASPASAGMDPVGGRRGRRFASLPRERGDGPPDRSHAECPPWPPPRARGWTRIDCSRASSTLASPASAGMDRTPAVSSDRVRRLPRERGDGPDTCRYPSGATPPPPRARGWTLSPRTEGPHRSASPASAGMDPGARGAPLGQFRLPRERGDGPRKRPPPHRRLQPPPRARGWTAVPSRSLLGERASPASAGMDLRQGSQWMSERRLPRERGDGPDARTSRARNAAPPPRARGWT